MSFKRVSIFRYGEIETYLILAILLFKQQMLFKLFEKEQQPKQCQRLKFSRLPPREYLTFFFFFSFLKHRYIIINRPIFWICCPQSFSAWCMIFKNCNLIFFFRCFLLLYLEKEKLHFIDFYLFVYILSELHLLSEGENVFQDVFP